MLLRLKIRFAPPDPLMPLTVAPGALPLTQTEIGNPVWIWSKWLANDWEIAHGLPDPDRIADLVGCERQRSRATVSGINGSGGANRILSRNSIHSLEAWINRFAMFQELCCSLSVIKCELLTDFFNLANKQNVTRHEHHRIHHHRHHASTRTWHSRTPTSSTATSSIPTADSLELASTSNCRAEVYFPRGQLRLPRFFLSVPY